MNMDVQSQVLSFADLSSYLGNSLKVEFLRSSPTQTFP